MLKILSSRVKSFLRANRFHPPLFLLWEITRELPPTQKVNFQSISPNIANPQLVISYLGYKSQIIKISSKTTDLGIIELEWDNKLEEVVVSGTLKPISKLDSPVPIEVYGQTFFQANPTASVFEALENVEWHTTPTKL